MPAQRSLARRAASRLKRMVLGGPGRDPARDPARVFDRIYADGAWNGDVRSGEDIVSGSGSLPQNSRSYEDLVVERARALGVRRIVDIGCGDFQVAGRILERLPEVDYLGLDVSALAVQRNLRRFAREGVRFAQLDIARRDPPAGDLALCREVLQHLPNAMVARSLRRIAAFPAALLTNCVAAAPSQAMNLDVPLGHCRASLGSGLDLTAPPFGLKAVERLRVAHDRLPYDIVTLEIGRAAA
ncbi:MAG: class I SAM-dependent methyltransferase [Pseudomonadota bacterium]